MKTHIISSLIAASIAAIWGYFTDLAKGQTGWYVARILSFAALGFYASYRATKAKAKDAEQTKLKSIN